MKKRVHYAILEDMQKYLKNFNPDEYIQTGSDTNPEVIDMLRNYYENNLPVDVIAWIRVNKPNSDLLYAKAAYNQISFVQYQLCSYLLNIDIPLVISTHYSKSVKLPVYLFYYKGIEFILRNNFYNWKVSVNSSRILDLDFFNSFDYNQKIPSIYCEGFPENKVYGAYSENHSKFTIEISNDYDVYAFFLLIKNFRK